MRVSLFGGWCSAVMLMASPVVAVDSRVDGRPDYAFSVPLETVESDTSAAAVFKPLAKTYLLPDKPWAFSFRLRHSGAASMTPRAGWLPESADLTAIGDGWFQISWTPSYAQIGVHELIVDQVGKSTSGVAESVKFFVEVVEPALYPAMQSSVRDQYLPPSFINSSTSQDTQTQAHVAGDTVVTPETAVANSSMTRGDAQTSNAKEQRIPGVSVDSPMSSNQASSPARFPDSSAAPLPDSSTDLSAAPSQAPYLAPIATQIVSAGRTLAIRIEPQHRGSDNSKVIIAIDRLPQNGSLDENPDGSKTFYWLTGDNDQGEHRFRFTVADSNQPQLQSFTDVLIIVGDPTRSNTVPVTR